VAFRLTEYDVRNDTIAQHDQDRGTKQLGDER
jgi:hypothetical protein